MCGGVWWCVVVCGGVWWCVVVCGGVVVGGDGDHTLTVGGYVCFGKFWPFKNSVFFGGGFIII